MLSNQPAYSSQPAGKFIGWIKNLPNIFFKKNTIEEHTDQTDTFVSILETNTSPVQPTEPDLIAKNSPEFNFTVDPASASFADLNEEETEAPSALASSDSANQITDVEIKAATPRPSLVKASIAIDALVEMELPPLPGSALRVALLSMDMNASTSAVAEAIGCDPVLATRILRAANSPIYAVERKFTSLTSAVNALGNLAINQLVVIYAVSDAFHQNSKNSHLERPLWRHSVAVAVGAREICNALKLRSGEEAFLCGLLHDIGKLLLMRHDAQVYEQVEKYLEEHERVDVEQEIYNFTHAEIGALVANRWGLADEVGRAIFDHHHPIKDEQMPTMTLIIDAADKMANAAGAGLRIEGNSEMHNIQSLAALGFTEQQLAELWEQTEVRLDEMMHVLSSLI